MLWKASIHEYGNEILNSLESRSAFASGSGKASSEERRDTGDMMPHQTEWMVLLIGGPSGVGKTIVARQIGLRFGVSWLQVDDLRLAFQRSHATFPRGTAALHCFEKTPDVWRMPP